MSALLAETPEDLLLEKAVREGRAGNLPYAGSVPPVDAWALVEAGRAVLVDVRSNEERKFVGYVPGSVHVAWATGTALTRNPRFLRELEAKVGKNDVVLLLCRSGKRSATAAEAATKIGFTAAFNVRVEERNNCEFERNSASLNEITANGNCAQLALRTHRQAVRALPRGPHSR